METANHKLCILTSLVLFGVGAAYAQEFPPLSQHIADCENKWILSESAKSDEVRELGYVYVDPTAGVTIELHGEVELDQSGALVRRPSLLEGKARVIVRVASNGVVACLSDNQTERLGLPHEWEYRDNYKDNRQAGPHYTAWASHFNQIGGFDRALEFVKLARAENYSSSKLELENGFALNALGRYDEAIQLLIEASRRYRDDVEITAELAYAQLSLHQYQSAIELYRRALSLDRRRATTRRSEFAHNIASAYGQLGDTKSEREWRERSVEWKKQEH
jgi:tetratricopeptide (TPR) repeat protein